MDKQDRRVFGTLDGLRGIAALAVVTRHVPDTTFQDLLPGSTLAVDLFFVLSGFVLAHSYTERLRGEMGAIAFMRVRIIRLYPLYILGSALVAAHFALSAGFNYRIGFISSPPQHLACCFCQRRIGYRWTRVCSL